jgi:hypothetical protein
MRFVMREDAFTVNVFEEYREHDKYTKTCDEIIAASKGAETESEVIAALESVNVFFDGWGLCYDYLSKKLTTDACRKAYLESINKNLPRRDFRMDREKYLRKAGFACWL